MTLTSSVALCTFNGEAYLPAFLGSLQSQSRCPDEIIVSDDGSTDTTITIVKEFFPHFPGMRLLTNVPCRAVVRNFDRCLQECTGDVVFLADQDDVWLPQKMAVMMNAFEADPEVGIVLSEVDLVGVDGAVVEPSWIARTRLLSDDFSTVDLSKVGFSAISVLKRNPFVGCAMAIRRSALLALLPIPCIAPMHDWWLGFAHLARGGQVHFIRDSLTHWRVHGANVTSRSPGGILRMVKQRGQLLWAWHTSSITRHS